jgi:hypothetical protein
MPLGSAAGKLVLGEGEAMAMPGRKTTRWLARDPAGNVTVWQEIDD